MSKNILIAFLAIIISAASALSQRNLEAFPGRDQKSSLQILPEIGGWKYCGSATVSVDSAGINSTTWYFDYSDFDSARYRSNIQVLLSMTGGAAAGYKPVYAYYKLVNYAGTASADSFWVNDMIGGGWTNSAIYTISLPPAPVPAKGIKIYLVNTGISAIAITAELWTGEVGQFPYYFESYSITDTINGDTASGVFSVINLSGMHSTIVTLDSIDCESDSFKFEIRPAWTYSGAPANTHWIELDSLKWRDWSDGYTRLESLDGYLPPCPFIEWRSYSGITTADTLGITIQFGGYRK